MAGEVQTGKQVAGQQLNSACPRWESELSRSPGDSQESSVLGLHIAMSGGGLAWDLLLQG